MSKTEKVLSNPLVVLREDFDDWAILFDPDTSEGYGLNPVSVFIWKCLDGKHSVEDICEKLKKNCKKIPDAVDSEVNSFIQDLIENGLAGYEIQQEKQ